MKGLKNAHKSFSQNLWKTCGKWARFKAEFSKFLVHTTDCTKFGHLM
jgi:hypothetical protein